MPRSGTAGSCGNSIFSFFETTLYCLPQWLHQLTIPPAVQECSLFSRSPSAFVICINIIIFEIYPYFVISKSLLFLFL